MRQLMIWSTIFQIAWVAVVFILFPSYTRPPAHYNDLRDRVKASSDPGRANIHNEKIFIAASIYDGDGTLVSGDWGNSVAGLVELLGPSNVFLSIYENDASEKAAKALDDFRGRITCTHMMSYQRALTD